jgi:hypothetical protein
MSILNVKDSYEAIKIFILLTEILNSKIIY